MSDSTFRAGDVPESHSKDRRNSQKVFENELTIHIKNCHLDGVQFIGVDITLIEKQVLQ